MHVQEFSQKSLIVDLILLVVLSTLVTGIYFLQHEINHTLKIRKILSTDTSPLKFELLSDSGDRIDVDILNRSDNNVTAAVGDRVKIRYRVSFPDGTEVDSTGKKMAEEQFVVGYARAIPGLDLGVRRIPQGARARLRIPWRLAYGSEGLSNIIPPKTDLIFNLEVLEIKDSGIPKQKPNLNGIEMQILGEMEYWILRQGFGNHPEQDQSVHINYAVWSEQDKLLHSSYFNDSEYRVKVGHSPIPGWNQLLRMMRPGQQIFVKVPPRLALKNRKVSNFDTDQNLYFWLEFVG